MKKKIVIIIIFTAIVFLSYYGIKEFRNYIYDMNKLPEGIFVESFESPNKDYILNVYKYSGGATMDWTLRVEVEFIFTGDKRNIYWNAHEKSAKIIWKENDIVIINGKELNVYTDEYDFRRHFEF